jgi:hypothetical protein
MSPLEKLKNLVASPKKPLFEGRHEAWPVIEEILGLDLPTDYKEIIAAYGSGSFSDFIYLYNPFCPFWTSSNLLSGTTKQRLRAYREGQAQHPQYSPPFRAYPEPGGLFPWASTDNGDTLFWLTVGSPDKWTTVVCDSKTSEACDEFSFGVAEFLLCWLSGSLVSRVLPPAPQGPVFTPVQPS